MPTIPEQLADLNTRLTRLADTQTALLKRIDTLEARPQPDVTGLQKNVDGAVKVAADAQASTKTFTNLVTEVKTELARVAQQTDQVPGLKSDLAGLKKTVSGLDTAAVTDQVGQVRGQVEAVAGRVTTLEKAPAPTLPPDLSAEVQALTTRVEAIQPGEAVDLAPVYAALNEVRETLGLEPVGTAPAARVASTEPAVGEDRAASLPDNLRRLLDGAGYSTDTAIQQASDEDLLAVKGIGGEYLKTIRAELPALSAEKDGE